MQMLHPAPLLLLAMAAVAIAVAAGIHPTLLQREVEPTHHSQPTHQHHQQPARKQQMEQQLTTKKQQVEQQQQQPARKQLVEQQQQTVKNQQIDQQQQQLEQQQPARKQQVEQQQQPARKQQVEQQQQQQVEQQQEPARKQQVEQQQQPARKQQQGSKTELEAQQKELQASQASKRQPKSKQLPPNQQPDDEVLQHHGPLDARMNYQNELGELRQTIQAELERRQLSKKDSRIAKVYEAAKKFGDSVGTAATKEMTPKENLTTTIKENVTSTAMEASTTKEMKSVKETSWFAKMHKGLPAGAWLALGAAALATFALLIGCCVCRHRCCPKSSKNSEIRRKPNQTLLHRDIDLSGSKKAPCGVINYSLEYDLKKSLLVVTVTNCLDLPRGLDNIDPYVVIKIDKDKKFCPQSRVVRGSTNPVFNFTRTFKIKQKAELKNKVVTIEIYDWDFGKKHAMLARKVVRLSKLGERLDEILGKSVYFTCNLNRGLDLFDRGPGDICVQLGYSQPKRHLTVTIIECKSVFLQKPGQKPDEDTLPNTYAKVDFLTEGKKMMTKRTQVVKASRNPYFNSKLEFPAEAEKLNAAALSISLVHKTETLGIKRTVGFVDLSLDVDKDSLPGMQWRELLKLQGQAMAKWLSLTSPEEASIQEAQRRRDELQRIRDHEDEENVLVHPDQ